MSKITLILTPEAQSCLVARAALEGISPEDCAQQLLTSTLLNNPDPQEHVEAYMEAFRSWRSQEPIPGIDAGIRFSREDSHQR